MSVTSESTRLELPVPSPVPAFSATKMQAEFEKIAEQTPRDIAAEQAFIAAWLQDEPRAQTWTLPFVALVPT